MVQIRDAAIAEYGATGPHGPGCEHTQRVGDSLIETLDHAYETVSDRPWSFAQATASPAAR
jgi:hypothetical protein